MTESDRIIGGLIEAVDRNTSTINRLDTKFNDHIGNDTLRFTAILTDLASMKGYWAAMKTYSKIFGLLVSLFSLAAVVFEVVRYLGS